MNTSELWETLGELSEDEYGQVIFQLFVKYEELQKTESTNKEAQQFFNLLRAITEQVQSCNVNRR